MAALNPRKRAASIIEIDDNDGSDSDCIVVASSPAKNRHVAKKARPASPLRSPLEEVGHNPLRRTLKHVLIHTSGGKATAPQSKVQKRAQHTRPVPRVPPTSQSQRPIQSFFRTPNSELQADQSLRRIETSELGRHRREQVPASVLEPQPIIGTTRVRSQAASSKTGHTISASRPRRSTGRMSYATAPALESSDDDMPDEELLPKRLIRARLRTEAEDEDYAVEGEHNSAEHVDATSDEASVDSGVLSASAGEESEEEMVVEPKRPKATARKTTKISEPADAATKEASGRTMMKRLFTNTARGLATSLPPLANIHDIFKDITKKALDLGLEQALKHLPNRPIRIATMCSGTESPLLALEMVRDALDGSSPHRFEVEHAFSAEIVPFKQAYIERNFAPPRIFRDITEFVTAFDDDEPMATTAYGAKMSIPLDVDIVIAGTSCVDYSNLNNRKKGITDGGESGDTWYGALAYCKACRPSIIIFENVGSAHWDRMLTHYREIGYECEGVLADTKDYYLPQTRQRGYMVCFDTTKLAPNAQRGLGTRWQALMEKFKRPASSPVSAFLLPNDRVVNRQQHRDEDGGREVDWSLCEIRQMKYRQTAFLGLDRPFTHWQESGAMIPPESGDQSWYRRLVEREKDSIDCVYLRASLPRWGMVDARFKTKVFDISQNIDRIPERPLLGIISCITPTGKSLISDANRLVSPEETLILQGLPLDRISFTTELPSELKDLAGNAMTTTVIGAALLSSLIVGYPLLNDDDDAMAVGTHEIRTAHKISLDSKSTGQCVTSDRLLLDLPKLLDDSKRASRRCFCEGNLGRCKHKLQECIDCGHTTCTLCGGNPPHNYREDQMLDKGRLHPEDFTQDLRSKLPLRISFSAAAGSVLSTRTVTNGSHAQMPEYLAAVDLAVSAPFGFQSLRRTHCWKAYYTSTHGRLELTLEDGQAVWRLFALSPSDLPCDDWLRISLEQPIGQALVGSSLLDCSWKWRIPVEQTLAIEVGSAAKGDSVSTWWARNGLEWFRHDQQPGTLLVQPTRNGLTETERTICGQYRYLPKCGMASDSLYMKTSSRTSERPIFLFLDPTRTGPTEQDEFVFSYNKAKLEYDEVRSVLARIKAPWRPWPLYTWDAKEKDEGKKLPIAVAAEAAKVVTDGEWVYSPADVRLSREVEDLKTLVPQPSLTATSILRCNAATQIVSCISSAIELENANNNMANMAQDRAFLSANAWVFEALRRDLDDGQWQSLQLSDNECTSCAPPKPQTNWKLLGDTKTLEAYEDPVSAGLYERAMKSRPQGIVVIAHRGHAVNAQPTRIDIGINLASLAHRAMARMHYTTGNVTFQWKLDTATNMSSFSSIPKFRLMPTTGLQPYDKDLRMSVKLFNTQRLALAWMRSQENGVDFVVEEAEEAILPVVGWRGEVRAKAVVRVRGGICADHPGFGKTITTLALIQAEALNSSPTSIRNELRSRQTGGAQHLLASSATLIICPRVLVTQWKSEAIEKLGSKVGIISIYDIGDLNDCEVSHFLNARIVLVNRAIFGSEPYADRLAAFAGSPGPAAKTGRAFTHWLQFALRQVPEHLQLHQRSASKLTQHLQDKYRGLLQDDAFVAAVPSRRLRGKDYVAGRKKKEESLPQRSATASLDTSQVMKPLFEMFYWNRVVVDEFHDYEAKELALINALHADKRWGLSGTPAVEDSYEIAQVASLLGVPLRVGSEARGVMKSRNSAAMRKELTEFEHFDAMRETPSMHIQNRIWEVAQQFLDVFVRRNVMDEGDMKVTTALTPVSLDLDHQALYVELSQHLNSMDMRLKRGKKSQSTDREDRLHTALVGSDTAEEALSKSAACVEKDHLDTDTAMDHGIGLQAAIAVREAEVEGLLAKLSTAIGDAVTKRDADFENWKRDVFERQKFGDEETTIALKQLVDAPPLAGKGKAQKPASRTLELDDVEDEEEVTEKSTRPETPTSRVNTLSKRLVVAHRSLRYLKNVHRVQLHATCADKRLQRCDSASCHSKVSNDVAVSAHCGHLLCKDCHAHMHSQHIAKCPAAGCNASMHSYNLLWRSKMGDLNRSASPYGAKLEAAMDILEDIHAKHDQAILFVQFPEQLIEAGRALADRQIDSVVVRNAALAPAQILDFSQNPSKTVIVLDAMSELAAGLNLQNANHVIFLSPLLQDSQYAYDARKAQAIGRVRRHGQGKPIYVYYITALDTIDVDILEHHEKRADAITELDGPAVEPPPMARVLDMHESPQRERMQLVKEDGHFSLRPQSWLVRCGSDSDSEAVAKVRGRNKVVGWEDFSSLVKFSKKFTEDDD